MEELIKELKIALNNKLYVTSINTCLLIPDICSALQSSNGRTNGKKYSNWFNTFVSDKYKDTLKGTDVYKLRCASVHQGKYNEDYQDFEKIIFQPTSSNNIVIHRGLLNNCLVLNIETFVNDLIESYYIWLELMLENPFYAENIKKSFCFHPLGVRPYIVGIPIIA